MNPCHYVLAVFRCTNKFVGSSLLINDSKAILHNVLTKFKYLYKENVTKYFCMHDEKYNGGRLKEKQKCIIKVENIWKENRTQ